MTSPFDAPRLATRAARRAISVPLLILAVIALVGFRQDDLDCEQAVSHLASCCPGLDTRAFDCTFTSGCGGPSPTQFSSTQSQCLESLDCPTIVSDGLCDPANDRAGSTAIGLRCP